jgi:abhydrolase domain-containing protein 17
VPTVDLASRYDCAGVILHAPLMSGMRVAFNTSRTWCCDAFPSIDKASRIGSLTLIIHGTDDEVIDLSHGIAIYEKLQKSVNPLWVEGAGHNDVEIYSQYIERLKRFITEEIPTHQYSVMASSHAQAAANALQTGDVHVTQPK